MNLNEMIKSIKEVKKVKAFKKVGDIVELKYHFIGTVEGDTIAEYIDVTYIKNEEKFLSQFVKNNYIDCFKDWSNISHSKIIDIHPNDL